MSDGADKQLQQIPREPSPEMVLACRRTIEGGVNFADSGGKMDWREFAAAIWRSMYDVTVPDARWQQGKWTPGPWHIGRTFMPNTPDAHCSIWGATPAGYKSGDQVAQRVAPYDARLIAAAPALAEALRLLYENTADYIRVNHLGDVHHNRDMQLARDALKAAGVDIPNCGQAASELIADKGK